MLSLNISFEKIMKKKSVNVLLLMLTFKWLYDEVGTWLSSNCVWELLYFQNLKDISEGKINKFSKNAGRLLLNSYIFNDFFKIQIFKI